MIHGVIMAGGSGTRFWPASRKNRPKQLLRIAGQRTMIRATVERILPEIPFQRIMVVTGMVHAAEIRNQIPELSEGMVVAEPVGKNTAPCIALAAYKLVKTDADAIMAVLPADHLIRQEAEFREALRIGAEVAMAGDHLLTFGIVPHRAETGYGYIQLGATEREIGSRKFFKVQRFVEKPDRAKAEEYVASGNFMWNSGMFIWHAGTIIRAFETYLPSISRVMEAISPALNTPDEPAAIAHAYAAVQSISIDYGIMEKADNVLTVPIDVGWSDVGSWDSLDAIWDCDARGNAVKGRCVAIDSRGCVVSSPDKLTALIGLENLIVVDTPDALLVCRKDRAQDVRKLQERLKELGYEELL
jgi:mannose-1-phosphate guanylyltransferase